MAFDPGGRLLAATAKLGGGCLWNIETGEAILPDLISMRASYYWCVRFHPGGKYIGFGLWSGFVELIDIADGSYILDQEEPAHHGRVSDIAFTPDGIRMVSGADDGVVLIWKIS